MVAPGASQGFEAVMAAPRRVLRVPVGMLARRVSSIAPAGTAGGLGHAGFKPSPSDLKAPLPEHFSVGKSLKLRAVVLDYELLARSTTQRQPAGHVAQPPRGGAAPARGASAAELVTDGHVSMVAEITGLLRKARSAFDLPESHREDVGDALMSSLHRQQKSSPPPRSVQSQGIEGLGDVRTKYMQKMLKKTGGRSSHPTSETKGDAELLSTARNRVMAASAAAPPSAWMLLEGAGELLQYLAGRSMLLCLLPGAHTTQSELNALVEQCNGRVDFKVVLPPGTGEGEDLAAGLQSACEGLGLGGEQVLAVSPRDEVIRAAGAHAMYTARHQPLNTPRRGSASATYTVGSIEDVRGVVEEVNGISYRG